MKLEGIPERIWLQYHGDADPADYPADDYPDADEVSWCFEPIFEHDIEYITLSKYKELEAQLAEYKHTPRAYATMEENMMQAEEECQRLETELRKANARASLYKDERSTMVIKVQQLTRALKEKK